MKVPYKRTPVSEKLANKIWDVWCIDILDRKTAISKTIEKILREKKNIKVNVKLIGEYIKYFQRKHAANNRYWWYKFLK